MSVFFNKSYFNLHRYLPRTRPIYSISCYLQRDTLYGTMWFKIITFLFKVQLINVVTVATTTTATILRVTAHETNLIQRQTRYKEQNPLTKNGQIWFTGEQVVFSWTRIKEKRVKYCARNFLRNMSPLRIKTTCTSTFSYEFLDVSD